MFGVFGGLEVLDLSSGIAGPLATMLLADNGASVTKIEHPSGDRFSGQAGYRVWNRGKRRLHLDLKQEEDLKVFWKLVDRADVLVESFSPAAAQRLGVGSAELLKRNPRLVVCSVTGYGRHKQLKDRPGYDALVSARTGLLFDQRGRAGTAMEYILGRPGPCPEIGTPEGLRRGAERNGPVFARTPWPSVGATYLAALGIAAALRARELTGCGQHVETSLLQGALAAVCLNWQKVEKPDSPLYWMWPTDSRSIEGLFECADGRWVHHWTVRPNWVLESANGAEKPSPPALDGPYRDDPDRVSMESDGLLTGYYLYEHLAEAFKKFPANDWVEAAESSGMGIALVRSPAEALGDESFLADGCVVRIDDPEVGPIRCAGTLLEFSSTPGRVRGPSSDVVTSTDDLLASMRVTQSPNGQSRSLAHPLSGVRVLDLGLGVAGPFTGRLLADLGADVIKVNALYDSYWNGTHMGLGTNRGKRSIALNLKSLAGRQILERLIAKADVLTTNWRPGAARRLGVDFESLHSRYPSLVHCNTRGFEKGPRSLLPGTDQTAAALTGTEWEDGGCDSGNPPMWSRSNMGDTGNALLAAIAITSALYHRDKTGEGQAVSTSIVNAGLLHTSYAWIHDDGRPTDWGHIDANQYGLSPYCRMYRCSDGGWIFVCATRPQEQATLLALSDDVPADPSADALAEAFESSFARRTARDWFQSLEELGVPSEIVDESFCRRIFDDPEARELDLVSQTESGAVGRFEDSGLLINFSETPEIVQRGPCLCGEHTKEVLLEHGYTVDEIETLAGAGVVSQAAS
jgi:crotonobetainyl-CoA:carnitine CoA-transferase CaiB-like acyl-CoA transferase